MSGKKSISKAAEGVITSSVVNLSNNVQTPMRTWDSYTNERIKFLHPKIRSDVTRAIINCEKAGYKVRITADGHLRLFDVQDMLYGHGRTKEQLKLKGINPDYAKPDERIITYAIGGESYHNYGLGVDIVTIDGKTLIWKPPVKVVEIFKSYGFEWGGDWKGRKRDEPHFQKTFGFSVTQLYNKHINKDFDKNEYVNL